MEEKRIPAYLGQLINYLNGDYYAGLDVGFDYTMLERLRGYTEYTTTYSDPNIGSSCTAYSVYNAMRGAVKYVLNKESLQGLSVAVKGIGKVGYQLVHYLAEDGVKLYVADNDTKQLDLLQPLMNEYPFMIIPVSTDDIHKQEVDIYSPCALGNDVKISKISEMKCKIICGAANNQLDIADPTNAKQQLLDQKIVYVPDTLANVGGVFRSAGVILKSRNEQESFQLIETVHDRTIKILDLASEHRISPADVCNEIYQTIDGKPNRFKMQLDGLTGVLSGHNTYRI